MVYYRQKDNSTRWRTISRLTVRDSNIFSLDCRFKKCVDHTFDHLQTWTVWKQCEREHQKALISDTKAPKSRKNHLKIKCATLRDVEAASSNLVTSTIKTKREACPLFLFLRLKFTDLSFANACVCRERAGSESVRNRRILPRV